ncbi:MAG TPA: alpha/beta hydrolase [Allosphingosinicella sp.]|jgi:acetyl esterase/lipase
MAPKLLSLLLLLVVGFFAAVACSPLKTFNLLVPKDAGGARVAAGLPYGEGPRRRLDVYAPRVAGQGRPVVIFFYGGAWNSGTREGYGFVGQALAARGFVVVIPDYRLVPEVRYPAFIEDGAAAVRWAAAHAAEFGGDPRRIVLAGHSAGAYIAAMLSVDGRWLGSDRALVRGFAGLAGPYDFAPFDVAASREAFGRWPKAEETQPVTWAGAGDPPALLLVGDADRTVLPRNSEALSAKLRAAGVPARIVRYSGLGHVGVLTAIARPLRGRAPVLDDVARFVDEVTRGKPTP